MALPQILDERATWLAALDGASLARIGDGELSIALTRSAAPGQIYDPALSARLREVMIAPPAGLLTCLPNIFGRRPRKYGWQRWSYRMKRHAVVRSDLQYGSAFISRPDYYELETWPDAIWTLARSIWAGREVVLVRGDQKVPALYDNAAGVRLIVGPSRDAWAAYDTLLAQCVRTAPEGGLIVLEHGPTATVLAADLAKQGYQALDLGKASRFYRRSPLCES